MGHKPGTVEVDYVNYAGRRGVRRIVPTGRLVPGPNRWHQAAAVLIEAWDERSGEIRLFDPAGVILWTPLSPDPGGEADAVATADQATEIRLAVLCERIEGLGAEILDQKKATMEAVQDAVRSPMGVVPKSAERFYKKGVRGNRREGEAPGEVR